MRSTSAGYGQSLLWSPLVSAAPQAAPAGLFGAPMRALSRNFVDAVEGWASLVAPLEIEVEVRRTWQLLARSARTRARQEA